VNKTEHNKIPKIVFTIRWNIEHDLFPGPTDATTSPSTTVQNGNAHNRGTRVEVQNPANYSKLESMISGKEVEL
jgi:hypothetical protein